ncbi:MAG: 2-oxoglutarate and iron-dependent oxygenase domain-containing protein [Alphaproteobacteria bacterium]
MNLFREHGVRDAAAAQIPVIDFGPAFSVEPGALPSVAAATRHARENIGFFYALNHGVPAALIDRAFAASRQFHALPLAGKLRLRLNHNNIGYLAVNASVHGASNVHKAARPNQEESYFVSHDRGSVSADNPGALSEGGLSRPRARLLPGQFFPPGRPPFRGGSAGCRG